jgi:NADP-reducing hydrogenase subunit HndB
MPKITSLDSLNRLKVELVMKRNQEAYRGAVYVSVGMGTCGIAAGAQDVFRALEHELQARGLNDVMVAPTGCIGLCSHEPILEVLVGDAPKVAYGKVAPDMVKRIVQEHILEGKPVEEFVIDTTPFPTI